MSPMPRQKPGRSKQNYRTPPEFLNAVKYYFGIKDFAVDLAADRHNAVTAIYYDEQMDSLSMKWSGWGNGRDEFAWLNPPYDHIERWVKKAVECDRPIIMLVPASVGANWWKNYVHELAHVILLNGRITFVGCDTPYPKDCVLLVYNHTTWHAHDVPFYQVWTWNPMVNKASGSRRAPRSKARPPAPKTARSRPATR